MKYAIILCDGMADRPIELLGGKTPMEAANCPNFARVAEKGRVGRIRTLYEELPTGSDVANLSVLGYDPHVYYTGRSPRHFTQRDRHGLPSEFGDDLGRRGLHR